MLTFYFVRHGSKEAIPFDPPLTKVGVKQAEITSDYLKQVFFKAIITSPKLRAKQTAEIIARSHSIPVIVDDRLVERLEWENKETFNEFIKEWSKSDLNREYQTKRGDSSINKGNIMKEAIDELSEKYNDGNILIVTHGGSIGDLLRNLFKREDMPEEIDPITDAPHIKISECSITEIVKEGETYRLIRLNDIYHLPTFLI